MDPEGLAHDGADAHAGVQRRVWILEHELDVGPQASEVAPLELLHLLSLDAEFAAVCFLEHDRQPTDCRLTAPRLANEAERLSRADAERDV